MTDMAELLRALYAAAADDVPACSSCSADSQLTKIEPGILMLSVHHDEHCPVLGPLRGSREVKTSRTQRVGIAKSGAAQ